MPQAIVTTYLSATNSRPSRIKASAEAGSVTLKWDGFLDTAGNHDAACVALLEKLQWSGTWARGWLDDNRRAVYVRTDSTLTDTVEGVAR